MILVFHAVTFKIVVLQMQCHGFQSQEIIIANNMQGSVKEHENH